METWEEYAIGRIKLGRKIHSSIKPSRKLSRSNYIPQNIIEKLMKESCIKVVSFIEGNIVYGEQNDK